MKCIICGHDGLNSELTMEFFSRGDKGVVIRHVPSLVCPNCGEVYHEESVTGRLLELANQFLDGNELVAVTEYKAA